MDEFLIFVAPWIVLIGAILSVIFISMKAKF